jgi:signal peptidase II
MIPLVALATLVLDQVSKIAVVFGLDLQHRVEMDVVPPYLVFRMAWNDGVNFGLLGDQPAVMRWVLVALALAISTWVVVWVRRERGGVWAQGAAGLLVGGALGNVIDRLAYGAVADFLNMSCCGFDNPFAFNLADVAVFCGALGLVITGSQSGNQPGNGAGKASPKRPSRRKTP